MWTGSGLLESVLVREFKAAQIYSRSFLGRVIAKEVIADFPLPRTKFSSISGHSGRAVVFLSVLWFLLPVLILSTAEDSLIILSRILCRLHIDKVVK
jgi:membrane-associated phospholipid phosphatase